MLKNTKPTYFAIRNVIIQVVLALFIYYFSLSGQRWAEFEALANILLLIILIIAIYFFLFIVAVIKGTSKFKKHYSYAMAATLIFWISFIVIFQISEPWRDEFKKNWRKQVGKANNEAKQKKFDDLALKLSKRFPDYRFYKTEGFYGNIHYITPSRDSATATYGGLLTLSVSNKQKMLPADTTLLWRKGMEMARVFIKDTIVIEIYKKIADKEITYRVVSPGVINAELLTGLYMDLINRNDYTDVQMRIDKSLFSPLIINNMTR